MDLRLESFQGLVWEPNFLVSVTRSSPFNHEIPPSEIQYVNYHVYSNYVSHLISVVKMRIL